jgi:glycosyltransferase involved in cell wall biosynthesis
VLIVSHYFPPHVGGIERVAAEEARRLTDAGHEVAVLTTSCGARPGDQITAEGFRLTRVRAWNGLERAAGVPFPVPAPGAVLVAWRRVRAADVVHLHDVTYLTSWLAAFAAWIMRRPLLVTQHVAVVPHPRPLVERIQRLVFAVSARTVLRRARAVIVLNSRVEEFLRGLGVPAERLRFLPNGVDTDLFSPPAPGERAALREAWQLPPDEVLALFVGRFVPKKGYQALLEAAGPEYTIVLVGGPAPQEPAVDGSVVDGSVPDGSVPDGSVPDGQVPDGRGKVRVLGSLEPAQLADVYRACDAFVLPSQGEGFPLTVQEAMASGLPVVTTDDPGYAGYGLDRDLVLLIPPSPPQIRAALLKVAASAQLRQRMGAYSRTVARERFSWGAHLDGLVRELDGAAGPPAGTLVEPG